MSTKVRDEEEKRYTDIKKAVEEVIASAKPFTDEDFPPQRDSIYNSSRDKYYDQNLFDSLEWKRASEIFRNPCVFD